MLALLGFAADPSTYLNIVLYWGRRLPPIAGKRRASLFPREER